MRHSVYRACSFEKERKNDMNLLNVLMNSLTSGGALQALSAKTGLSQKQLKMIMAIAIPLLLKKMTSNASSQAGASSLLGALGQHRGAGDIQKQLDNVDEEDGAKIVGHILGDEQDDLIQQVAGETGVEASDVQKVMGNISPSVLSGLSEATQVASMQQSSGVDLSDGFDMSDVMGLLGGASQGGGAGSLLGSLFGGGQSGGLLGTLMGGEKPEADQSVNGNQLIQSLLSFM